MVLRVRFNLLAVSLAEALASKSPIALPFPSGLSRGMLFSQKEDKYDGN